jgi:predicted O-methyltransferase YrrM
MRKAIRRVVPRRLRRLAKISIRLVTGFYVREFLRRHQAIYQQLATQSARTEAQDEILDLLLRRLRRIEEESTTAVRALREELMGGVEGLREGLTNVHDRLAEIDHTGDQLQYQINLLRTHLYSGGITGPVNLKANALQEAFVEADSRVPREAAVVEIGCMRYPFESPQEGASTLYLARWCQEANRRLISVDVQESHMQNAKRILRQEGLPADFINGDGKEFIANFDTPIALLFLDGSNEPGETLDQFRAAERKLADGAVVVIDDVQKIGPYESGKGELAIPYAKETGWDVDLLDTEPGFRMAIVRRTQPQRLRVTPVATMAVEP